MIKMVFDRKRLANKKSVKPSQLESIITYLKGISERLGSSGEGDQKYRRILIQYIETPMMDRTGDQVSDYNITKIQEKYINNHEYFF